MPLTPKPDGDLIAQILLFYRTKNGLTQRQLAASLGVSPGLVGEMERGKVRSRPAAAKVLALEVG